ncbi:MAG: succinate dehydrogenase, hydrophobic membrane anchor protein [Betaproteobacteria bacterium]
MVRRDVVGAHYGLRDWLMQRITAIVITLYLFLLLGILLFTPGMDLVRWQALFGNLAFKLATFVVLISVFLHSWVGMRDIIMDYVRPTALRLTLEVLVIGALVVYAGWSIQILWGHR